MKCYFLVIFVSLLLKINGAIGSPTQGNLISGLQCWLSNLNLLFQPTVNPKINFLLFTRNSPDEPCDLQPTREALEKCPFNPQLETKVLIAGWSPTLTPEDVKYVIKNKLLEAGEFNVIVHNWTGLISSYSDPLSYPKAFFTSYYVGFNMGAWIRFLQNATGVRLEKFHLLAHSLGANIASYAGKTNCNLGRITFWDPDAVGFRYLPECLRATYTDANFVEVIHTSGGNNVKQGYSFRNPIGDIDFYANDGQMQPHCYYGAEFQHESGDTGKVTTDEETEISCSHNLVITYYIESFNRSCSFKGMICDSYQDFMNSNCPSHSSIKCDMGFYSKRIPGLPIKSKCYFKTNKNPLYCHTD